MFFFVSLSRWKCGTEYTMVLPGLLIVYSLIQLLKEIGQLFIRGVYYFMDVENYIELSLYICALIFAIVYIFEPRDYCIHDQHSNYTQIKVQSGSLAILLAYCNLLLHLKRFPFCGLVVVMFIEVLRTVISVLIVFSIVLVGFALSFHFLVGGMTEKFGDFTEIRGAIVKVVSMTIGEGSINVSQRRGRSATTQMNAFLYLLFALLMPIVMMNLMVRTLYKTVLML